MLHTRPLFVPKIVRRFWFDTEICTPDMRDVRYAEAHPDGDLRVAKQGGSTFLLHRVGPEHFATVRCGSSNEWAILAREFPDGKLSVTTSPLAIRFRRWAHGLAQDERQVAAGL